MSSWPSHAERPRVGVIRPDNSSVSDQLRQRARALVDVARALTQAGYGARADRLAEAAEQAARAVLNPTAQAWALADVAQALAQIGRTTPTVRPRPSPTWRARCRKRGVLSEHAGFWLL